MARTKASKKAETQAPATPPKRGRGRPRKVAPEPEPAEELENEDGDGEDGEEEESEDEQQFDDGEADDAPPELAGSYEDDFKDSPAPSPLETRSVANKSWRLPPGANPWQWLANFKVDQWTHLICYLWRTAPKFDAKFGGRPTGIDKFTEPFDQDHIKRIHGSGGYRIDVCRINPATQQSGRIAQIYFEIIDQAFPPKLPYGDWVNYPENGNWKWGHLNPPKADVTIEEPTMLGAGPAAQTAMFNTVFDAVQRITAGNNQSAELTAQLISKLGEKDAAMLAMMDPARQFAQIQQYMDMFGIKRPGSGGEDTGTGAILKMMQASLDATREEMKWWREKAMAPAQPTQASSVIDMIVTEAPKVKEALGVLGINLGGRGAAAAAATSTNADLWVPVINGVTQAFAPLVPAFAHWLMTRNNQPAQGQQQQVQQQPPTPLPAAAQTINTTTVQTGAPMQQPQAAPPPATGDKSAAFQQYGQLLQEIAPFLIDEWNAGNSGFDFRDWFLDRKGRQTWEALKRDIGPETFADEMLKHPVMGQIFKPAEKVKAWMIEVFSNDANPRDVEDQGEEKQQEAAS